MLEPAGPASESIAVLWWVMLSGASALLGLVLVLLRLCLMPGGRLRRVRERHWLIAGGLVLPGVVLTPLAVYGFVVGERTVARPGPPDVVVEATGRRWAWDFSYPQAEAAASTNVLHVPAGRSVDVRVMSVDVIHSFWVPRLAGKIDAIPGHVNIVRIRADLPGTYRGVCAEFCGFAHAEMTFVVEAHDPSRYAEVIRHLGAAQ